MMKMYVLYDVVGDCYEVPFFAHGDGFVKRALADLPATNPTSMVAQHPADFQLFSIGDYDQKTGDFTLDTRFICLCSDLIAGRGAAVGGIPPQDAARPGVTLDDAESN